MFAIGRWIVLYFVASVVGEIIAEITGVLNRDEDLRPVAIIWFVLLGLAGGLTTGAIIPDRILPLGPFTGVSVLVLPLALAAGMAIVGSVREGHPRSHLASWYGGAAVGLGLAVGRLAGLAFAARVRAL